MIILPYKEKFIRENFIEFSFSNNEGDLLPDFKLFEKLNSTDQFYLAQNYKWDNGVVVLKWIIESRKCDKGTASLIFWESEPDYYFERSAMEISDAEKEIFFLLKRIVEKFNLKEFKKSNLKYDPEDRASKADWKKKMRSG